MRVLVTGAAGFIGSRLTRALVEGGHQVVALDNLVTTLSLRLLAGIEDRIEFVHGDIRCREDLARLPPGSYDRVYHLAASFANELSLEHPTLDMRSNIEGSLNVIEHARMAGCGLFVYAGSSSSYGNGAVPFREDGPTCPTTPYAMSKLVAETHVRTSGLPFSIFRFFNAYGPGDPPGRYRNVIPNMFKALDAPNGRVHVYSLEATRDFTFVDDLTAVLLDAPRAEGELVNVGSGVEVKIADLARQIVALLRLPEDRITFADGRPWDQVKRRVAHVGRLRELFGKVPETPMERGLAETARWLRREGIIRLEVP